MKRRDFLKLVGAAVVTPLTMVDGGAKPVLTLEILEEIKARVEVEEGSFHHPMNWITDDRERLRADAAERLWAKETLKFGTSRLKFEPKRCGVVKFGLRNG